MRTLPETMQAALTRGLTTHCWCWRIERSDGLVIGSTDHDRTLSFDGTDYAPGLGFGGAASDTGQALAAGQGDLDGAVDNSLLTQADLEAGLWSGARIETWRVDWGDVSQRVRTATGTLGDVQLNGARFEAEWLGPAHPLSRAIGRSFTRECDAVLGDVRCGVSTGHADFELGCDQRLSTCRDRFANSLNFRGFPYMVGNDVLLAGAEAETRRDGSSRGLGS